jgi:hypothetical protein
LTVGGCCPIAGDLDDDGDVDLADFGRFQGCFDGLGTLDCTCADLVVDGVVEPGDLDAWTTALEVNGGPR